MTLVKGLIKESWQRKQ